MATSNRCLLRAQRRSSETAWKDYSSLFFVQTKPSILLVSRKAVMIFCIRLNWKLDVVYNQFLHYMFIQHNYALQICSIYPS